MNIFPAIDLFGGNAVRLFKGDYNQMTVYNTDPAAVAEAFRAQGASFLHMVDLEGARDGGTPNKDTIRRVVSDTKLFTELGGGIRTLRTIEDYLEIGVNRVILGTAAVTEPGFVEEAVKRYGAHIAVGADLRDGQVAIKGWTERTGADGMEFCRRMEALGVSTMIVTDISRDGAMRGTNRALYKTLSETVNMQIIASGGVSTLDDVAALRAMNLYGAIIGKAYYTGAIDLAKAIEVAK